MGIDCAADLPRAASVNQRQVFEDGFPANYRIDAKAIVAVYRVNPLPSIVTSLVIGGKGVARTEIFPKPY